MIAAAVIAADIAMVALVVAFGAQVPGLTQSRCVSCHVARADVVPGTTHVRDWQQSAHGRAQIGCERCHGGDPTAPDVAAAHRGVVSGRLPASPVHRTMLPKTCGACHRMALDAFRRSRHFALLAGRDPAAPSCSTCHGTMKAQVLAPDALERTCAGCHAPGTRGESYPEEARAIVADVNGTRADLDHLQAGIATVSDAARRERLLTLQMRATAAILDAAEALHAFDLPRARTRALEARARTVEAVRAINERESR